MNDPNRIVRDWTEEDEIKYREMLATPVKRLTEEEMLKLAAVSPHPPLGASLGKDEEDKELIEKLKNPPQFEPFDSDLFTEKIAETANKTAQVSHDLEMKRIKAKLIADLCKELVKTPIRYEDVPKTAREIAEKALETATENANVSQIAKMQQQIDTFKAALLHARERILHGNKCDMVVIDPLDDCDKHHLKTIFKFIDEHATENPTQQHPNTHHEPQRQETTVFDIYPQIKQSNAINIVVKSLIDDFTTYPEAELNYDDLNDFAKIFVKSRRYGYVTVIPMNANNAFRKTFIEPNLNEKGFLRQDRFATELYSSEPTQSYIKYKTFEKWTDMFFLPLVQNTIRKLKPSKPFILNIGSRTYPLNKILTSNFKNLYIEKLNIGIQNTTGGLKNNLKEGESFYLIHS